MEPKRLLLHACCGPCSLEPVRILQAEGYEITLAYVNPNIQPVAEYQKRLDTLQTWAQNCGISVIEGRRSFDDWEKAVAPYSINRPARCAACYRMRLNEAAAIATDQGFSCMSTTLAVSPYQLFEVCEHELMRAAGAAGRSYIWRDFRPYYPHATTRARELGMYRQNCCGCRFSAAEAALDRSHMRDDRRLDREIRRSVSLGEHIA